MCTYIKQLTLYAWLAKQVDARDFSNIGKKVTSSILVLETKNPSVAISCQFKSDTKYQGS